MNRYPGLVACDPETRNVWVCIGGSDALGWHWGWIGPLGSSFCSLEILGLPSAHHPSLARALRTLS